MKVRVYIILPSIAVFLFLMGNLDVWASKKEKWFFAGCAAGGKKPASMEYIRQHYGSIRLRDDKA